MPSSQAQDNPAEPSVHLLALISDLHSNWGAVRAVLEDIDAQEVSAVVCLGDLIGYGAEPKPVVDAVRERCATSLLGNHDAALLDDRDAFGFNERALEAIDYTRSALDPEREEHWAIWDWLGELQPAATVNPGFGEEIYLVHASPCEPLLEYLLPNFDKRPERLQANFDEAACRLTFYGHTHHPGWFAEGSPFVRATDEVSQLDLEEGTRYLINVGSVGQPRDADPRACYALYDGQTVRWRRVPYDHEAACRSIHEASGLPDSLGDRLLIGR